MRLQRLEDKWNVNLARNGTSDTQLVCRFAKEIN